MNREFIALVAYMSLLVQNLYSSVQFLKYIQKSDQNLFYITTFESSVFRLYIDDCLSILGQLLKIEKKHFDENRGQTPFNHVLISCLCLE